MINAFAKTLVLLHALMSLAGMAVAITLVVNMAARAIVYRRREFVGGAA